jgi:hypothetical protein
MKRSFNIILMLSSCCSLLGQQFNAAPNPGVSTRFVDASSDPLMNTVLEVQATTDGGDAGTSEDVITRLNNFTNEKGLIQGWDNQKKRMVTIGYAFEQCENPAFDSGFILKRELLFKRAILQAKTDIIKSILSEMSAEDQLNVPGSPIADKLNEKRESYQRKINAAEMQVQQLLNEMGEADLAAKKGTTFDDRTGAFMDAVIKRLDADYDSSKFDADKKARYEEAKKNYQQALIEKDQVVQEAQELKGEIESEISSTVEISAAMPVMGGNILYGYEYYNRQKKSYEVGVVYGWSKKSEEAARACLMGEKVLVNPNAKRKPLNDWIQTQDLSTMVGPRSYIDHEGKRWTLGISAREVPTNRTLLNRTIASAKNFAMQMTCYALLADVESHERAEAAMQISHDGKGQTQSEAIESLEQTMSQSFKNRVVKGLSPLVQKKVMHPISGREMFVAVYRIDPYLSEQALKLKANSVQFSNEARAKSDQDRALNDQLNRGVVPASLRQTQSRPSNSNSFQGSVTGGGQVREGGFGQEPDLDQLDDF